MEPTIHYYYASNTMFLCPNPEPSCHCQINIEITLFAAWMLLLHYYFVMVSNLVIYYDNIFGDWLCFMEIQVIHVPEFEYYIYKRLFMNPFDANIM